MLTTVLAALRTLILLMPLLLMVSLRSLVSLVMVSLRSVPNCLVVALTECVSSLQQVVCVKCGRGARIALAEVPPASSSDWY